MESGRRINRHIITLIAVLFNGAVFGQTITLSPLLGPPTTSVEVSGEGFTPGASIHISFDGTDEVVAIADGSGAFAKVAVAVPASAQPGAHTIGATPSTGYEGARAAFTVNTDWAQYGFSPHRKFYNPYENVLSTSTVAGLKLQWSFQTGGAVNSPPAVVNGVAYFGSQDGNVYAVDASTGSQVWSFATGGGVSASPAVEKGVAYIGSSLFYALDASTGAELWSDPIGNASSPVILNETVYFGTPQPQIVIGGSIYALDANTGQQLWQFTNSPPYYFGCGNVAVAYETVYGGCGYLTTLDATTGAFIWRHNNGTSFGIADGVIYSGQTGNTFYALKAGTGVELWNFDIGCTFGQPMVQPAIGVGVVYASAQCTRIYALDSSTGSLLWSDPGQVTGSPVVANGLVYIGVGNELYALDGSTGHGLWGYVPPDGVGCSPVVVNGTVYVCSGNNLLKFSLK
jgi:eukaryotic-like serine/threonine-protein kinase